MKMEKKKKKAVKGESVDEQLTFAAEAQACEKTVRAREECAKECAAPTRSMSPDMVALGGRARAQAHRATGSDAEEDRRSRRGSGATRGPVYAEANEAEGRVLMGRSEPMFRPPQAPQSSKGKPAPAATLAAGLAFAQSLRRAVSRHRYDAVYLLLWRTGRPHMLHVPSISPLPVLNRSLCSYLNATPGG